MYFKAVFGVFMEFAKVAKQFAFGLLCVFEPKE
jgi:hypothetical protein